MSEQVIQVDGVEKAYRFFRLSNVSLALEAGPDHGLRRPERRRQVDDDANPDGDGRATTAARCACSGRAIPEEQAAAKRDVGYVSEDMRLHGNVTLAWHMKFIASIYPGWDPGVRRRSCCSGSISTRSRTIKALSHGERVKATLLLVLARRPRLLLLDEPTTGLDPVARHEILAELMDVVQDERRAMLFSSHNTQDVEQISDQITFIDRGRIIDSSDKETFLDRWRRLHLDVPPAPRCRRFATWSRHDERPHRDRHHQRLLAGHRGDLCRRRHHGLRRSAHDARGDLRGQRHEQPAGAGSMSGSSCAGWC